MSPPWKAPEEIRLQMGRLIKKYRESSSLKTGELAAMIPVTNSTLRDYERGRCSPSILMLFRLAKSLDVSVHQLLPEVYENLHGKTKSRAKSHNRTRITKASKAGKKKKTQPRRPGKANKAKPRKY